MSRLKILIADDDPDILLIFSTFLGDFYDVLTARDGLEAWQIFEESRPRLVIMDLNMPGINGLDLTEKIRNHPERADTPVIIVTGTTRGSDLPPGFWNIGTAANLMLEKPIRPDELLAAVRRILLNHARVEPLPPGKGYYQIEEPKDSGE